jgi:hypothetical protein
MHQTVLVAENLEPQRGHGVHALALRKLREVLQTIIFERVFFPLLEELLKPQVFRRDPDGMGETRLRTDHLIAAAGMHQTVLVAENLEPQRGHGVHALAELLKNVLLVMNASGFLLPPSSPRNEDQARLWTATLDRDGRRREKLACIHEANGSQFRPSSIPSRYQVDIMNASGFLLPPSSPRNEDQARLWTATFERIQPFLVEEKRS